MRIFMIFNISNFPNIQYGIAYYWRRKWQSTPVFLPGESHELRGLAGYSPQGHKTQTRLSD